MTHNRYAENGTELGWTLEDSIEAELRVKDPHESPESWDVCMCFIDPMGDWLEKWLQRPSPSSKDIEYLDIYDNCLCQHGDTYVAWERALVELSIHGDLAVSLKSHIRAVGEKAREATDELARQNSSLTPQKVLLLFTNRAVRPCLRFLRNVSVVVKRRQLAVSPSGEEQKIDDGRLRQTSDANIFTSSPLETTSAAKPTPPSPSAPKSEVERLLKAVESDPFKKRVLLLMGEKYDQEGVDPPTVEALLRELRVPPRSGDAKEKLATLTKLNAFEPGQGRRLTETGRAVYKILQSREKPS